MKGFEPKDLPGELKIGWGKVSNASTLVQGGVSTVATVSATLKIWPKKD